MNIVTISGSAVRPAPHGRGKRWLDLFVVAGGALLAVAGIYSHEISRLLSGW